MIALAPLIDALKAAGFAQVEGELELAKLAELPSAPLSLFVVSESEAAEPNRTTGLVDQRVTERLAVVVSVRAGARFKDGTAAQLRDAINRVVATLAGWTHPEASGPLDYTGRETLSVGGHLVSAAVRFTARSNIWSAPK